MKQRKVSFNLVLPSSEAGLMENELKNNGAELDELFYNYEPTSNEPDILYQSNKDPFLMIQGRAVLNKLIASVIDQVRQTNHSGLIMNATGQRLIIKEDPALENGMVAISTLEGLKRYNPKEQKGDQRLIVEVLKIMAQ
jgi:hypothetical protein